MIERKTYLDKLSAWKDEKVSIAFSSAPHYNISLLLPDGITRWISFPLYQYSMHLSFLLQVLKLLLEDKIFLYMPVRRH